MTIIYSNNIQEQIWQSINTLPLEKQQQVLEFAQSLAKKEDDLLSVFDRIGRNAQTKGLTEEILAELLADES